MQTKDLSEAALEKLACIAREKQASTPNVYFVFNFRRKAWYKFDQKEPGLKGRITPEELPQGYKLL